MLVTRACFKFHHKKSHPWFEGVPVSAALGGTARSFQEEIYEQQRGAAGQNIQLTVADYTEVNEMLCHCSDLL